MTQGPHQSRAMSSGPFSGDADSSRGDEELLGRTVSGKYKIEKFLGGGAMGAVYKARFAALEKYVAVKVMHRSIAIDPNFVGRFHREAKAASRLDHPNSMRVIDFGEEPDGLLYIAMEYVEGRDLYRVIHEDWPISNADIADVLMQALAAIAVAHEMGVIHRDLKPENLMILRQKNDEEKDAYHVKVCDFGIAKITEKDDEPKPEGGPGGQKLTTQGLVVGTPEYMSPEQAKGEKLDARSDIYSMGVILYQLLTGRTPFSGDTPLAVVLKHITENPPAPSVHYAGVHKGLEAVCLRALAKDRNERWQTARAMRNAVREALEGRPMPVDIAADTLATGAPGTVAPGTHPMSMAGAPIVVAQGMSAPAAAIESAPTVAGGITASHLTPLGTAAAAEPPKKSRAGLAVGLGVAAVVLVGGTFAATRLLAKSGRDVRDTGHIAPLPTAPVTAPTAVSSGPSDPGHPSALAVTTAAPPPMPSIDPKTGKRNPVSTTAHNPATNAGVSTKGVPEAPPTNAVPVPVTPPPPEPPPVAVTPPPPAPVTPPPAPVFNPATCRAAPGAARSNGAVNSKDLSMGGAAGAWTSCARSALREKPPGPISANVHLNFSDNGAFRGASCSGCPAPLAACVASSTRGAVSLNIRGGDVTGEPAFDVPVTFTCE